MHLQSSFPSYQSFRSATRFDSETVLLAKHTLTLFELRWSRSPAKPLPRVNKTATDFLRLSVPNCFALILTAEYIIELLYQSRILLSAKDYMPV